MTQRTLVLLKPDAVRRGQVGEILRRIEAKGYALVALELRTATPELLAEHYAEHEGKPFYQPLVDFMLSGPVVAIVLEGERCIEGFRSLAGATDPHGGRARHHPRRPRPRLGPGGPAEPRARLRLRRSRPSARSGSGSRALSRGPTFRPACRVGQPPVMELQPRVRRCRRSSPPSAGATRTSTSSLLPPSEPSRLPAADGRRAPASRPRSTA